MRARRLLLAGVVLLGAMSSLWAAPFSKVPAGHWAYRECSRLASLGLISADSATNFSGDPQLTRFEFGLALLDILACVDDAVAPLGPQPDSGDLVNAVARALGLTPRIPEEEVSRAAAGLRRLSDEFGDELRALNFNPSRASRALQALASPEAVRAWRAEALAPPGRGLPSARVPTTTDTLRVPFAHGTVALTLPQDPDSPRLLNYLARSAAALRPLNLSPSAKAEPALADPQISRLRTAYEYGLGSALTLSLAYEEVARRGQGQAALDAASLASVGLGYQLTSSTSVKLSYSLLEYSNYVLDTPPLRDRMAETAVSIEF